MTRSKWSMTLVIDLQLYKELLAHLEIEIAKLNKTRTQVAWDYLQKEEYHHIRDPWYKNQRYLIDNGRIWVYTWRSKSYCRLEGSVPYCLS